MVVDGCGCGLMWMGMDGCGWMWIYECGCEEMEMCADVDMSKHVSAYVPQWKFYLNGLL